MARELLFQRPFIFIEYDDVYHFVYHQWNGYVPVKHIKEGCEAILEASREKSCPNIISDQLEVKGTWSQALKWMGKDYLPRLVSLGDVKIAFIYSRQMAA